LPMFQPALLTRNRCEMLKMPVDARKATEATGGVLDSTSKRMREHDAAGMGRFGIAVDCW
jgi:hypothetical protein